MKKYVIFTPVEVRGIYDTWAECQAKISKCKCGHSFKSFKNVLEARRALAAGTLAAYEASKKNSVAWKDGGIVLPCIVVDAACSGAPGPVEYRGVLLPDCSEVFRIGPLERGTNNIGEFLAIVHGLRWMHERSFMWPLYSDSAVAIKWVTVLRECNTHAENIGLGLVSAIDRAERWLRASDAEDMISAGRVRKWDTKLLGEIPADFGRK